MGGLSADYPQYLGGMLAGIEDISDDNIVISHLIDDLVSPFGYRPIVAWYIFQVFLSGVFFREVPQAIAQLNQGLLYMPGCTYRVLCNIVVDFIK